MKHAAPVRRNLILRRLITGVQYCFWRYAIPSRRPSRPKIVAYGMAVWLSRGRRIRQGRRQWPCVKRMAIFNAAMSRRNAMPIVTYVTKIAPCGPLRHAIGADAVPR